MTEVWYVTREAVVAAPDIKETAQANAQVGRAIETSSRTVEALCHRRFYPLREVRAFDWPQPYSRSWRLWLDGNELLEAHSITSGGVTLAPSEYLLRRSDGREGPATHIEIDLSQGGAWSAGSTHQRAILIDGTWGSWSAAVLAGSLAGAVATTDGTQITVANGSGVGVGDLLRVDDERMIVTDRRLADTGQDLGTALTASAADTMFAVADGAVFAPGEVLLIDAERMMVLDVAGDNLVVKRAFDGSVLAAHSTADIYAPRSLTVARGVLGTTAATHASATPIARHTPPPLVRDLSLAGAVNQLLQESSGYARTSGSGENAKEYGGRGLAKLREDCIRAHGRRLRARAI
ncbi:hypothetical protein [Herbidospora daliensis]|uniref:hypothetical protein n=1 Tax=Herbidospora daliensis TaxID=295585 RepID=UPI000785B8B0|nr:hypothetical protein [Herbidospora daliensis]